ncbi:MAG: ABC transporter permease [Candidatus Thorarchaeota archaeon]|nr:ABC transporter permease [Candidatus Thorarchaeota archaeon]
MSDNLQSFDEKEYPEFAAREVHEVPFHAKLVSNGGAILMCIVLVIVVDAAMSLMTNFIVGDISGLDYAAGLVTSLSVRIIGLIVFVLVLWIGVLGKPLYEKRPGRVATRLLKVAIVYLLLLTVNLASAFIAAFMFFFLTPRRSDTWSDFQLLLYRAGISGVVVLWTLLESFLTVDVVGVDVLPNIMMNSVGRVLASLGFGWIAVSACFIIIPLFILLPRALKMVWGMRRSISTFWMQFYKDRMGLVGFFLIAAIVLIGILAPVIAPYHWSYIDINNQDIWYLPPSWEHLLGTNHQGGDIFSRVIWGTQISLIVGFTASVMAVFLGTFVGLFAGYYGGLPDSILMRITDVFLCLPTLPLMLIFLVLFGQGLQNIIIVIAILSWTGTARMVRSEALSLRERPLTEAAHAIGASDMYILSKHILPNTLPLILANVVLGIVGAILSEAGIAFLGFTEIHGQPSWGIILHWAEKKAALSNGRWWWIIPPGLMIMLTTLGFAFISHAADRVVNPRLRGRSG